MKRENESLSFSNLDAPPLGRRQLWSAAAELHISPPGFAPSSPAPRHLRACLYARSKLSIAYFRSRLKKESNRDLDARVLAARGFNNLSRRRVFFFAVSTFSFASEQLASEQKGLQSASLSNSLSRSSTLSLFPLSPPPRDLTVTVVSSQQLQRKKKNGLAGAAPGEAEGIAVVVAFPLPPPPPLCLCRAVRFLGFRCSSRLRFRSCVRARGPTAAAAAAGSLVSAAAGPGRWRRLAQGQKEAAAAR